MIEPDAIFLDPDGLHYVALFDGTWLRWPAVESGWLARKGCSATLADACSELDAWHARLALRLSGVGVDDDR